MAVTINVTAEDIATGNRISSFGNPLALALARDNPGKTVKVGKKYIYVQGFERKEMDATGLSAKGAADAGTLTPGSHTLSPTNLVPD